jgi:uncharacterized protein (DUF362 family)
LQKFRKIFNFNASLIFNLNQMSKIKRRDFLKTGLIAGSAVLLSRQLSGSPFSMLGPIAYRPPANGEIPDIVSVPGADPENAIVRLLEPFGGIAQFVHSGQTVGLLVNSPWKNPGYYTKPDIVVSLANLFLQAGAKEIVCFSQASGAYWERGLLFEKHKSMIEKFRYGSAYVHIDIPKGVELKQAKILKELKDVDVFFSVPVAKHHAGVMFSGNLKGMMGTSSDDTNRNMHSPEGDYTYDKHEYLAQCIADLNLVRKPDLCIMDATECAINNGPAGPGETMKPGKILAGKDPVAMDVYAANLIGFYPEDILTVKFASEHGLGELNPEKVKLLELKQ